MHFFPGTVPAGLSDPHLFLAPRVVAVPVDPASLAGHTRFGRARPVYPAGALSPQPDLRSVYWYRTTPGPMFPAPPAKLWKPMPEFPWKEVLPTSPPVSFDLAFKPAPVGERRVWSISQSDSQNGILFDNAAPGSNVALRPKTPGPDHLCAWMLTGPIIADAAKKQTVAADVGFRNGFLGMPNKANVQLFCYKVPVIGPLAPPPPPAPPPGWTKVEGSKPMVPLDCEVPGGPPYRLLIGIEMDVYEGDPAYPLALWGVRVVPAP